MIAYAIARLLPGLVVALVTLTILRVLYGHLAVTLAALSLR